MVPAGCWWSLDLDYRMVKGLGDALIQVSRSREGRGFVVGSLSHFPQSVVILLYLVLPRMPLCKTWQSREKGKFLAFKFNCASHLRAGPFALGLTALILGGILFSVERDRLIRRTDKGKRSD